MHKTMIQIPLKLALFLVLVLNLTHCTCQKSLFSKASPVPSTIDSSLAIDSIPSQVFMGEAYPSGNVYLQAFSEEEQVWPKELVALPLVKSTPPEVKPLPLQFKENLTDSVDPKEHTISTIYIPNFEKMEEDHNDCGKGKIAKNPSFSYLDSFEFFDTIVDNCNGLDGVARYSGAANNKFAYWVLAVPITWSAAQVSALSGKRPPTAADLESIREAKANTPADYECTTHPAFIDSAEYKFSVKNNNQEMKISNYSTPGCAGHVSEIYILDLYEEGKLLKTFFTFNYTGPL